MKGERLKSRDRVIQVLEYLILLAIGLTVFAALVAYGAERGWLVKAVSL